MSWLVGVGVRVEITAVARGVEARVGYYQQQVLQLLLGHLLPLRLVLGVLAGQARRDLLMQE